MTEASIDSRKFEIRHNGNEIRINDSVIPAEIHQQDGLLWQVMYQGKSYEVLVHEIKVEDKLVVLELNGKRATVKLRSRTEKLLEALGMTQQLERKIDKINAPMPGMIHRIHVEKGQTVEKGTPLLILEAMKMENVIKSPGAGVIKEVNVAPGENVEKNHLLITFE